MGIGLGVLLIALGLVFMFALKLEIPSVTNDTLGLILILVGIACLFVGMALQFRRGPRT